MLRDWIAGISNALTRHSKLEEAVTWWNEHSPYIVCEFKQKLSMDILLVESPEHGVLVSLRAEGQYKGRQAILLPLVEFYQAATKLASGASTRAQFFQSTWENPKSITPGGWEPASGKVFHLPKDLV